MRKLAEEKRNAALLNDMNIRLDGLTAAAARAPDETARTSLIDTANGLIAGAQERGLLSPEDAQSRRQGWAQSHALQMFKAKPAREQQAVAQGFAAGTSDPADPAGSIFGLIPQGQWPQLAAQAERDATVAVARGAVGKTDKWKRDIVDASEDLRNIPRTAIENDTELDDTHRADVLRSYDEAQHKAASFQDALQRFRDRGAFSPDSGEDRQNADMLYDYLGGDETAARAVYQRTGIVPPGAAEKFPDMVEQVKQDTVLTPVRVASNDPNFVPEGRTAKSDQIAQNSQPETRDGKSKDSSFVRVAQNAPLSAAQGIVSNAKPFVTDGTNRIEQKQNTANIRKWPLSFGLEDQLNYAAYKTGLRVEVHSGGQFAYGRDGKEWTGSNRHDDGNAADLKLFEVIDGKRRYLNSNNEADRQRMEDFIHYSVIAGATGIGHGDSYMGAQTIHIGGGTVFAWKEDKERPALRPLPWVRKALDDGIADRQKLMKEGWNGLVNTKAQGRPLSLRPPQLTPDPPHERTNEERKKGYIPPPPPPLRNEFGPLY